MPPRLSTYTDTQPLSIPAAAPRGTLGWEGDIPAEPRPTEPRLAAPRRLARRRGKVTRVLSSIMLGGVIVLIAITVGG
jgi:hypothetical protein